LQKIYTINDVFQTSDFLIIGHRGAAGLAMENTIDGFRLAIELGCPMLELDVQRIYSANGKPKLCVFHDERLDRITNATGLVSDYSVESIKAVRTKNNESIPLLEDVFELVQHYTKVAVNIELKSKQTATLVAELIQEYPQIPVLVSSFHHGELALFRDFDLKTSIAPLLARWNPNVIDLAQQLGATTINISSKLATKNRIRQLSEGGFPVCIYTVNSSKEAEKLRGFGARGIFTDRPDKFQNYLRD
jgi:glycerophosphoryl diester phosphodiesterase